MCIISQKLNKIKASALYIINSTGIVYHQPAVLYIIKPQENARWRVMISSSFGADDILVFGEIYSSKTDDMPNLRFG